MHAPPRVRGGLAARLVILVAGLFVFAAAIVVQLESRLGLSPWDTLHQGIARHTPLSFGMANICVSVVTVVFALGVGPALEGGFLLLRRSRLAEAAPAPAIPMPAPLAGS